jgi:ABC-type transport system substrate-binding protein
VTVSAGGPCGNTKFSTSTTEATVNIAANADQWLVSDSGSGTGYSSSAFVYPLNSNLNEPLIIMNSDYTITGGLAASWERIPVGTPRNTIAGTPSGTPPLPSSPTAYPNCGGVSDRPFCADTWRFHLRQGVSFHDGQPFNADDVIWTWRDRQPLSGSPSDGENTLGFTRALSPATPGCSTNLTLCGFDSVEKIDSFTVDVTPRTQNLRFPEQVLHPKGAIVEVLRDGAGNPTQAPATEQTPGLSSPRNLGRHLDGSTGGVPANSKVFGLAASPPSTSNVTGTPQGTGPFKYVSYSPTNPQGGGSAKFVINPNYWGTPAQVHGMNYTFISDPTVRTAGLQSGQYDMAIDLDPLAVAPTQASGQHVVTAPYGQNSLIYVNKVVKQAPATIDLIRDPPLTPPNYMFNIGTDPAVRKASSLAIDRSAYLSAIYAGNAALGRWMGPPNILGSFQNVVPAMATDAPLARTTLDSDGWTCGTGAPGAGTACAANEFRKWNGDSRFTVGRQLDLYMVGISLVPQTGYDLMAAQMKTVGINLVTERGHCDSAAGSSPTLCLDGTLSRAQMYASSLFDFDVELPNQNDANAAFLPALRMGCATASNFRFAPADGTNGRGPALNDSSNNGGGVFPFGNTPCNAGAPNTTPVVLGPFDATYIPASNGATTQAANQSAAADMMRILVGQNETNIVIPIVGQYRIYGMSSKVNLGDAHPSQTSQRWTSLTMTY